jgi:hypothetical protein
MQVPSFTIVRYDRICENMRSLAKRPIASPDIFPKTEFGWFHRVVSSELMFQLSQQINLRPGIVKGHNRQRLRGGIPLLIIIGHSRQPFHVHETAAYDCSKLMVVLGVARLKRRYVVHDWGVVRIVTSDSFFDFRFEGMMGDGAYTYHILLKQVVPCLECNSTHLGRN